MRLSRTTAIVVTVASLAMVGCGSSDDDKQPASSPTTEAPATTTAPAATATTTTTTPTTTATNPAPSTTPSGGTTAPTTTSTEPSGGTPPPSDATAKTTPKDAGGDQPTISVGADGNARATAGDGSLAELWCDAAQQGAYDSQVGEASTLVITVRGSDSVRRCELPR